MAYSHTSSSTTSSNVSGSYIGENNAKRENGFGVPASYILHRLLVFTSFIDVDLDEMLDGICCLLGVLVDIAGATTCVDVPCVEPCHGVMGVDTAATG